jgi:hypothetical protein
MAKIEVINEIKKLIFNLFNYIFVKKNDMDNKIYFGCFIYYNYRRRGANARFCKGFNGGIYKYLLTKKNKHGKSN